MGKVVLITGASAGLGEEFAWQLADQGVSLLLVARRGEKLQQIQQQILGKYPHIPVTNQNAFISR